MRNTIIIFILKLIVALRNYFGVEVNTENSYISTYPVFLDVRYLRSMVRSGYSIFTNKFLDNPYSYKTKSHKFYYMLIKLLFNQLNDYSTNRGFPLKYSSSFVYLPLRALMNLQMRRKKYVYDLTYSKWRNLIKLDKKNNLSFDDYIKFKVLS